MIKKTILKTFTVGLISSFILLGNYFVNASNYQLFPVSLDKSQSYRNSAYEVGFLPKGRYISMYLGTSKNLVALSNEYLIRWGSNGGLYIYYNSPSTRLGLIQGFFQYIKVCDEIDIHATGSNIIENCGASQQAGVSNDIITNFINKVKLGDYVYIEDNLQFNLGCGSYCTYDSYNIEICYSSNEVGKTMCFLGGKGGQGLYANPTPLTQSQSMSGLNFANIPQSYLSDPPGFTPGGSGTGITINTSTNQNYVCPTIGQLMSNMGKNYSTGLCYNNTTYFNGSSFEQVDKQNIFTIFNDNYENYTNRISIYRNNCNSPANNNSCANAFSGEFKKYSIISNAINSNVDEKNLRNYCNLGLNYDPNATTCVANQTGVIKENYTAEEQLQLIIDYGSITTPGNNTTNTGGNEITNNNVINVLNGENREEFINNRNFLDSLGNIYGKITGLFKERNNVNGIIPEYILRITYITLLFTVIFKK